MDRREFLKILGITTASATLAGCNAGKEENSQAGELGPVPTDEMTYRSFPALGEDKVSLLGYGCMRWPTIPNPEGKGDIIDQDRVNELVDYAIGHGVNFFDTSPVYVQGMSERATGIALKRHPRESYYVSTKLSNFSDSSRENSLAMYQRSFRELQVDYIDYYLLHSLGGGGMDNFRKRYVDNGMLDFLQEERKAGRIRHLGWSFHGSKEVFDEILALHETYHWDFVLLQMNYVDWHIAKGSGIGAKYLYEELEKRGIPVQIMEPLLGGRLSKVPDHVVALLKEKDPERSVASWAFRFAGSHDGVLTVLSGMTYMDHLQDNIKTYSPLVTLTDEEKAFLEEIARLRSEYPEIPCTQCQYCMPCPYGLDIPTIFSHYNKCVNEGLINDDKEDSEYRKDRRAYLIGYDRALPKLRQADRCISCGICVAKCPQHISIPGEIRKIDLYVEELRRSR